MRHSVLLFKGRS